ncbi:unnamed protein product [Angiostrongylus costaricensis]|uniref:Protein kinase domain-containing protein n=1 Tax=Angiostrongylus costaricensis TaxID=334426 RepID=A0A0R3Q226_ANGCS|nr:unnamed protein product [Angiostrongylus costaricensis]
MPTKTLTIEQNLEDYVKLDKVGEGGKFGGIPATAIREISMLQELRNPNVVELISISLQENRLYLVFEFIALDLRKYLDAVPKNDFVPRETVQRFAFQICQAMCFVHQRRIIHRDLKPQNLLVDEKGTIKVADLGLSRSIAIPIRMYTHAVVTLWYRSPEILLGTSRYGAAIDVWAVGCILAEIAFKKSLFNGDSEIDQLFQIFRLLGTPTEKEWRGVNKLPEFKHTFPKWKKNELAERLNPFCDARLVDLIQLMLKYDPSLRISMRNALYHKYFDNVGCKMAISKKFRKTNEIGVIVKASFKEISPQR